MALIAAPAHGILDDELADTTRWMSGERFDGMNRLYTPRQVVEQRGAIETDHPVARVAADRLHARLDGPALEKIIETAS